MQPCEVLQWRGAGFHQLNAIEQHADQAGGDRRAVAAQQAEGSVSRRLQPVKDQLLELIALLEAGIDFAEDDYIKNLGKALGMKADEYKDLTVDYEIEDVRAKLGTASLPPPTPKK